MIYFISNEQVAQSKVYLLYFGLIKFFYNVLNFKKKKKVLNFN